MKNVFERAVMLCAVALMLMANGAVAEDLRIIGEDKSFCDYLALGRGNHHHASDDSVCQKIKAGCSRWYPSPALFPSRKSKC